MVFFVHLTFDMKRVFMVRSWWNLSTLDATRESCIFFIPSKDLEPSFRNTSEAHAGRDLDSRSQRMHIPFPCRRYFHVSIRNGWWVFLQVSLHWKRKQKDTGTFAQEMHVQMVDVSLTKLEQIGFHGMKLWDRCFGMTRSGPENWKQRSCRKETKIGLHGTSSPFRASMRHVHEFDSICKNTDNELMQGDNIVANSQARDSTDSRGCFGQGTHRQEYPNEAVQQTFVNDVQGVSIHCKVLMQLQPWGPASPAMQKSHTFSLHDR